MKVVFVGNCQAESLATLYKWFVLPLSPGDSVEFIPSYEEFDAQRIALLNDAGLLVEQRLDLPPKSSFAEVAYGADRVFFPMVSCGFLWPFAGTPHPANSDFYDSELSDSFLNRMIADGVEPKEAVSRYLALDVPAVRHVDRMMELVLDRQRARDEACGIDIAWLIEAFFRSEAVFRSPHHPNARIMLALSEQLFRKLGAPADALARMRGLRESPFPRNELPIHPRVADYFGLSYAHPTTLYRIHHEGRFTFEEFCFRYMAGERDRALADAINAARHNRPAALDALRDALVTSPKSSEGWRMLGDLLYRLDRPHEAIDAVNRAIHLDPDFALASSDLARLLRKVGDLASAFHAARRATALNPIDTNFLVLLGQIALQLGRLDIAVESAQAALELKPGDPHACSVINHAARQSA